MMLGQLLFALALPAAHAQEPQETSPLSPSVGLQFRQFIVADPWLDKWLRSGDLGYDRPSIGGQSYAITVAPTDPLHGLTLFFEYGTLRAEDGYWNADAPSGPTQRDGGVWVRTEGVGFVGGGLQFRYAVPFVQTEGGTDVLLSASLELGAAGGVGTVKLWHHGDSLTSLSDCENGVPAPERTQCPADDRFDVPGFLPIAGFNVGAAVRLRDQFHLLIECGVHQLPDVSVGLSYRL
jgi:hypothetical protein